MLDNIKCISSKVNHSRRAVGHHQVLVTLDPVTRTVTENHLPPGRDNTGETTMRVLSVTKVIVSPLLLLQVTDRVVGDERALSKYFNNLNILSLSCDVSLFSFNNVGIYVDMKIHILIKNNPD